LTAAGRAVTCVAADGIGSTGPTDTDTGAVADPHPAMSATVSNATAIRLLTGTP
jgi:hypothetical protein